ncbi:MAG: hypothetical protein RL514_4454 [Verrucomicrobiota bacterium]
MTTETIRFQDEQKLRRNGDIIANQFDGETVMMDAELDSYFGMAAVGTRIWNELETETTFGGLIHRLLQQAGSSVDEARCRAETALFLTDLHEQGFLLVDGQLKVKSA